MKETVINIYSIMQFIIIMFAVVGGYNLLNNIAQVLGKFGKDKLDNKKDIHAKDCDTDVMQDLIQTQIKYPDVKKEFIILPEKEQNIENNQEIHEINKKLDILQRDMDEVRRTQRGGV